MYIHYGVPHTDNIKNRKIFQFYYPDIKRINFYYWIEEQLSDSDKESCVAVFRIKLK